MATLVGFMLACLYVVPDSHAALYPGAVDQPAVNSGAPLDMSQGFSPNMEKQAEARYLQGLRGTNNPWKVPPTPDPHQIHPPVPGTSGNTLPPWLTSQLSRLLPLNYFVQPFQPPASSTTQQQFPQQMPPSPHLPPQMPRQMPPQMPPQMPQDQSPFGPQLPYNPQFPKQQQFNAPPPHFMPMPGRSECSGYTPGSLCCDGILNPLPPGGLAQWGCCHKGMYDITTQMCCGDIPVPKPMSGPPLMCCGTMLFNPATHLCCGNFPVPNPSGMMRCCRNTAYNPATQLCCAEALRPRSADNMHMNCCGKHMYNPRTHMCCDEGNTLLKDPSTQCCGKNFFQPALQQCCFGDALPKDAFCVAR